jgi:hypothetical protein
VTHRRGDGPSAPAALAATDQTRTNDAAEHILGQQTLRLNDTTELVLGYDPRLTNYFAHLWVDATPAGTLGLLETFPYDDDLIDALPEFLAGHGLPVPTEEDITDFGEAVVYAKGGAEAALLQMLKTSQNRPSTPAN